jgi:membrane associated rhomboid family serine protease
MPPVVKNLLIINGLTFLATITLYSKFGVDLTNILGLHYIESPNFRWYQFITHMFMHGNFTHIFSNMFALWMFGTAIENYWGSKRFLYYYLFTGLGAATLHMFVSYLRFNDMHNAILAYKNTPSPESFSYVILNYFPEFKYEFSSFLEQWSYFRYDPIFVQESFKAIDHLYMSSINIPTVGASGAVFGILLAFGVMFPNSLIYVFFMLPIKAKYFVILYGFFEFYSGIMNQPGDNVAHFAHLGGMIFGLILILYWRNKYRQYL